MVNAILNLVPLAQSTALLGEGVNFIDKKNKKTSDFIGPEVKTIVGTKLIGTTANIINE